MTERNTSSEAQRVEQLTAGILHELNSPLGAALSATDTLARLLRRAQSAQAAGAEEAAAIDALLDVIRSGLGRIGEVSEALGALDRKLESDRRSAAPAREAGLTLVAVEGRLRMPLVARNERAA